MRSWRQITSARSHTRALSCAVSERQNRQTVQKPRRQSVGQPGHVADVFNVIGMALEAVDASLGTSLEAALEGCGNGLKISDSLVAALKCNLDTVKLYT